MLDLPQLQSMFFYDMFPKERFWDYKSYTCSQLLVFYVWCPQPSVLWGALWRLPCVWPWLQLCPTELCRRCWENCCWAEVSWKFSKANTCKLCQTSRKGDFKASLIEFQILDSISQMSIWSTGCYNVLQPTHKSCSIVWMVCCSLM